MDWITQFFGRLHPLLVHFPIGILILAFLFECISRFKAYRKIKFATQPTLLLGMLSSIAAAISGYLLSLEGGYDDDLLEGHKNFGIATAVFAVLVYLMRNVSRNFLKEKANRKAFFMILFVPLVILVSITGHLGGSLTHGEDYLFDVLSATPEVSDPSVKLQAITDIDNAVYYTDVIQPILESRCYSCHSSRKEKGELRLDGISFITRGGEHGPVVEPGNPDSSSIFQRLMLPLENEDHMPPNEKPQPASAEIALIQTWIKEGGNFEMKIADCTAAGKIKEYYYSLVAQSQKEQLIPQEEVDAAEENMLSDLNKNGILAIPVSKGSNYISISFVNNRSASDADLEQLLPLKKQIVWINLSRTKVTDAGMSTIAQLSSLRQLNLERTSVSDKGLQSLSPLSDLRYLNLVGTKITDEGLEQIKALKSLRNLFLYQTSVSLSGIRDFALAAPHVQLDTGGYQLPKLLTDSVIAKPL